MGSPSVQMDAKSIFLEQLGLIERIIASIARRHALVGDDADDFASWTRAKLIENEYAILRKFQGRSSISTYLTVVIANLFRDYRTQQWGRWRPSVAARRLGPLAVRLETLLYRDGYTLDQAIEVLRSSGGTGADEREISGLAARIPARVRATEVDDALLAHAEAEEAADGGLWASERMREWERARSTLERALAHLPAEDQLVLRLRFWEGFTVAEISRVLHLEQKPLYRRIDRDLQRLRDFLEAEGVDATCVASFLSSEMTT
ncbi:MAG TPA: sigma-70 family RNA polymerase sigma factor [Longimicrobiaceae bacterium]|nr:sigma-70 family RNA polymerase sigma factor [Longimicrobiaceae bacterium]